MDINIAINPSERSALMHLYLTRLRPLMIESALFADGTPFYRQYYKKESGYEARLRFRTAKDNVLAVAVEKEGVSFPMKKGKDRQII